MNEISIVNRAMTSLELARMNTGFDEDSLENDVALETSERFTFVGLESDSFVGCASGLAYKNNNDYTGWFFLTDMFVEKDYRSKGLGAKLLKAIEKEVSAVGVKHIWLWTSGDAALRFYFRYEYQKFAEMENWYSDGSSRVGLRKNL